MKKLILGFLFLGMAAGGFFSTVNAQDKKKEFSLNMGAQGAIYKMSSFGTSRLSLDARMGIDLGSSFQLSPEFMIVTDHRLLFNSIGCYPGVMLNHIKPPFFIGVGAVLPIYFIAGWDTYSSRISPKVNIGFKSNQLMLTVFMLIWNDENIDFFEISIPGITLGYRF